MRFTVNELLYIHTIGGKIIKDRISKCIYV